MAAADLLGLGGQVAVGRRGGTDHRCRAILRRPPRKHQALSTKQRLAPCLPACCLMCVHALPVLARRRCARLLARKIGRHRRCRWHSRPVSLHNAVFGVWRPWTHCNERRRLLEVDEWVPGSTGAAQVHVQAAQLLQWPSSQAALEKAGHRFFLLGEEAKSTRCCRAAGAPSAAGPAALAARRARLAARCTFHLPPGPVLHPRPRLLCHN